MVSLRVFPECHNGKHHKCPGAYYAEEGTFGGSICQCACHRILRPNPIPSFKLPKVKKPGKKLQKILKEIKEVSREHDWAQGDGMTKKGEKQFRKNLKQQGPVLKKHLDSLVKRRTKSKTST